MALSSRFAQPDDLARAQVYSNVYPAAGSPDAPSTATFTEPTPGANGTSEPGDESLIPAPTSRVGDSAQPAFTGGLPISESSAGGTIILSVEESGYFHLFAYHPQALPFTRLTSGNWDDITPAISPDGARLAFASNRDGQWDLYLLDLLSGSVERLTETPEYDASPTWSPDNQWLAYESYVSEILAAEQVLPGTSTPVPALTPTQPVRRESLELFILPLAEGDTSGKPIRLTTDPAADHSPSWSPAGRQIAFVSNRSGDDEVWLADLDRIDDRFQNLSRNSQSQDRHPIWSPDGSVLAWNRVSDGFQEIWVEDFSQGSPTTIIGTGEQVAWNPEGSAMVVVLSAPNRLYLTGYDLLAAGLTIPPVELPGAVNGMTWATAELPQPLPDTYQQAASLTPSPPWQAALTPSTDVPGGRQRIVEVEDLEAPYPMLNDLADESFRALRERLTELVGWDYLSSLESAFVPLTSPMYPGLLGDWLFSGRAIAVNTSPINAGWLVVEREDYGSETYWRLYLRARYQDGTQGTPLHRPPWNFNARNNGDPRSYEQGGAVEPNIPGGYWVDLTRLAAGYGWERLPALTTWRSAFGAARFNELVYSEGLDWQAAMQEIYPVEALATPTPIQPPTYTPTSTRWPTRTPTPTRTPRPTYTPTFTRTPTATVTPTMTRTPIPSTP